MVREWQIKPAKAPSADLLNAVEQNLTIAGYLLERGISTGDQAVRYLHPNRNNLTDPGELPDMDKAVERIKQALFNHESIGIWGDFDVDGQTATAVLVECLTKLGASVPYYLPVRGRESHGIALPALKQFMQTGIQLLITCDTGISEHAAVQYASEHHLDVIITDHHTLPETLPPALACVNPRRLPEEHALGSLSGSATAFEVMLAVCREMGKEEIAFDSIDLAAIGLIADLAPLKKDARLLAQLGLERLSTSPRSCILAMLEAAGMSVTAIDEQTIGYILAPRLNAAGRLEDANPLVRFLMDQPPEALKDTAERLEALNANRKWLCDQVYQAAVDQLVRQPELADAPVIMLSNPTWPGGVLGLVAGRLAADFNRPAILLNDSTDGLLRGSARSVEGINITEAIASAAPLLQSYGGHPMAAGLSLSTDRLADFKRQVNTWLRSRGLVAAGPPPLEIDAQLSLSQITREFFQAVRTLAPFGKENPPLVFAARELQIAATRPLGRNREHFKFILQDAQGNALPLVWWNADETQIPAGRFDLAFALSENVYKGETTLQAEWIDIHPLEEPEIELLTSTEQQISDFRSLPEPLEAAIKACNGQPYLIFQEPPVLGDPLSSGRYQITSADNLILASLPPSPQALAEIIRQAQPRQIMLAMESPGKKTLAGFLQHLAGLIQYAVKNRDGFATLKDLAQASNSREDAVEAGIRWLEAAGKIAIRAQDQDLVKFEITGRPVEARGNTDSEEHLRFLLQESSAYQNHLYQLSTAHFLDQISAVRQGQDRL